MAWAKFDTNEEKKLKFKNAADLIAWPFIKGGTEFHFKNGEEFTVKYPISCDSKKLIYFLTCNGCGEHNIGQTGETSSQWPAI